jgi:transcriptional pleiotropic regulator of transition state genes
MVYSSYKRIDEAGRIVLSKDIRRALDLDANEMLKIDVEGDKIIITKAQPDCIFCGKSSDLKSYMGKCICNNCLNKINNT